MTETNPAPTSEEVKKAAGTLEELQNDLTPRLTLSHVLPDGRLADMVWIPEQEWSGFAVGNATESVFLPELFLDADGNLVDDPQKAVKLLVPLPAHKGLVRANFIKFASGVEEYSSSKDLFNEVRTYIKKYMVLDDEFYDIAALYAMMTWVYDRFHALPYLRVIGNYGTGKSRFVEVIGNISYRAIIAGSSITPAALYRTVDLIKGTLAYDEADMRNSDMSADLVKVLNGGHSKGKPVLRMDGEGMNMQPRAFEVFGPKILGSREPFSDLALESRCLTQRLFPKKDVKVPVHLPEEFDKEAATLRNKLLAFRMANYHTTSEDESSLGNIEFPRLKQSALAITSLAKDVDASMLPSLHAYLEAYEIQLGKSESTDVLADVLLCILRLTEFDSSVSNGKLYMRTIAQSFSEMFYDDYATRETKVLDTKEGPLVSKGQQVSARQMGAYVDRLGLSKDRSGAGIFVDIGRNKPKLEVLAVRYGIAPIIAEEKEKHANRTPVPRGKEDDSTQVVVEEQGTEKLY